MIYVQMYSARIVENARGNQSIFPDSKPHPYIDFMSSQCTVIVFIDIYITKGGRNEATGTTTFVYYWKSREIWGGYNVSCPTLLPKWHPLWSMLRNIERITKRKIVHLDDWFLTPLSNIFQLYHGNWFYWWKNIRLQKLSPSCFKSLTIFII